MSKYQRRIMWHAMLVLLLGLLGGFGLVYKLIGQIIVPPLPMAIAYDLPGTAAAWKAVHLGNILNAVMAMAFVAILPMLDLTARRSQFLSASIVAVIWGNASFYAFAVFAPNRGLSLGGNQLGEGNVAGLVSAVSGVLAAYLLVVVTISVLLSLRSSANRSETDA